MAGLRGIEEARPAHVNGVTCAGREPARGERQTAGPEISWTVALWEPVASTHVICAVSPGTCSCSGGPRVFGDVTSLPSTLVMTAGVVIPALAAGPFGSRPVTSAPDWTPSC